MSVISGLLLKEMYEPFVGTNKTVRNIGVSVLRVSVERGSTVVIFSGSLLVIIRVAKWEGIASPSRITVDFSVKSHDREIS